MSSLLFIIRFYDNAHLITPFITAIIDDAESLKSHNAQILLICDSLEDSNLQTKLEESVPIFTQHGLNVELMMNENTEGFVRSINKGLSKAVHRKMDVLLLDPGSIWTLGSLSELRAACATDSMIGFVSPRSNYGAICSIIPEGQKSCTRAEGEEIHRRITAHLPRFRYVPFVDGCCIYIRYPILAEFGLFHENEEQDLILRANKAGYRAVLANHLYIHHLYPNNLKNWEFDKKGALNLSQAKPAQLRKHTKEQGSALLYEEQTHLNKLCDACGLEESGCPTQSKTNSSGCLGIDAAKKGGDQRWTADYYNSPEYLEESVRTRYRTSDNELVSILFDLSFLNKYHYGISQHAVSIIKASSKILSLMPRKMVVYVSIDENVAIFHGIHRLENINLVPVETNFTFDAAIRIGQPSQISDLIRMATLAPVNLIFMEDTISWDCYHLRNSDLDSLLKFALKNCNGIFYSSDFTRRQFLQRFGADGVVCLLSTDPSDYAILEQETDEKHMLVVGSHYAHKAVPETVKTLAEFFPDRKIVVLGAEEFIWENVQTVRAGYQPEEMVHRLYKEASEVVYPSHYEGFGFPVVQSLAYRKKIFARNTPLLLEIAKHCPRPDLIIPFEVIADLANLINSPKPLAVKPGLPRSWADHTSDILLSTLKLCAEPDVETRFRDRLNLLHSLNAMDALKNILQSRSWKVTRLLKRIASFARG